MTILYRAYAADNRLLYVGISDDVERRMKEHRLQSSWYADCTRLTRIEYPTREAARIAEEGAIRQEKPEGNPGRWGRSRRESSPCGDHQVHKGSDIRALVASAPKLTPEQAERLRSLLPPVDQHLAGGPDDQAAA